MVMRVVAAFGIGLLFGGSAIAQPLRAPVPVGTAPLVLVDHDGKHDNGRHLGWYKHRGHDNDEDNDDRRSTQRRGGGMYGQQQPGYAPYAQPPGYGSSYPPGAYGGYGYPQGGNGYTRPYYRGY